MNNSKYLNEKKTQMKWKQNVLDNLKIDLYEGKYKSIWELSLTMVSNEFL